MPNSEGSEGHMQEPQNNDGAGMRTTVRGRIPFLARVQISGNLLGEDLTRLTEHGGLEKARGSCNIQVPTPCSAA